MPQDISPAEQVIAVYERRARQWLADRERTLFSERKWLDQFMALLPGSGSVLDLGCGCGTPIAQYLIEHGFEVTGVDSSQTMISLCRERFPDREWLIADMRALSLQKSFNGIIAWDSFFHLSRDAQRRTIPVFRQHLTSEAALLFTSGPSDGEAIGDLKGDPLYHASLSTEEYRSLLSANGFAVLAHVVEDPDCGQRTVWLARLR